MNTENNRKKILFILPYLGSGGAEKVVVQLLVHLDKKKYNPVLVLFERKGEFLKDIPDDINIYDLKKKNRFSFPALTYKLAMIIKHASPALIVSFLMYSSFVTLLAKTISRKKVPVIVAEHSVPLITMKNEGNYFLRKRLYQFLYPKAEKIITVTEGVRHELTTHLMAPDDKVKVIHNAVDLDKVVRLSGEPIKLENNNVPAIIAVGRLSKPKGYPYLLKALKRIREHGPVHLYILGEGKQRKELERLVEEQKISDSISFIGFQENPYKYIAQATLFVQSSLWESFSIVLIEAMACGVPVISTRCPYGPEEIITDGINGLLVPVRDERALADAIIRLLKDNVLRKRLSIAGKKRAEDFGIERMLTGYERVFEEQIDEFS